MHVVLHVVVLQHSCLKTKVSAERMISERCEMQPGQSPGEASQVGDPIWNQAENLPPGGHPRC